MNFKITALMLFRNESALVIEGPESFCELVPKKPCISIPDV